MATIPNQQPTYYNGVPLTLDSSPMVSDILGHNTPAAAATDSGGSVCVGLQSYPPYPTAGFFADLALGWDGAGVAFPAGIYWIDGQGVSASAEDFVSPNSWNQSLIAVPATLPVGYTPRGNNDTWNGGGGYDPNTAIDQGVVQRWAHIRRFDTVYAWIRGHAQYSNLASRGISIYSVNEDNDVGQLNHIVTNFPRLLQPDGGLWDYRWGPMNAGQQVDTVTGSGGSIAGGTTNYTIGLSRSNPHVGWRNIRAYVVLTGSTAVPPVTRCELKITRNADWSAIGAHATVVATITLIPVNTTGFVVTYQGDGINIAPPDGTLGVMYAEIQIDTSASAIVTTVGAYKRHFSPRVDIPLPYTVAGYYLDADCVAPGGYLPALIAAPDLRPNGALTGAYQFFDPTVCGDSKSVIVTATLTAGAHTLDTDPAVFPTSWNTVLCVAPDNSQPFISGFTNSASFTAPVDGLYVFKIGFDLTTAQTIKLKIT